MDEYRKTAMISNSTSLTSSPAKPDKLAQNLHSDLFLKELQQQLHAIRNENGNLAANSMKLQTRIHELEEDKIVVSSNFNKENAELQSLVTRLQSQLERGEAARQSLEYDLAVVKKKFHDVTKSTTHKEVTMAKENIQLSDEKSSLELKLGETENELIVARKLTVDNEKRIAILDDEKRQIQTDKMASEAILRAQCDKLSNQINNLQYENEQLKLTLADSKKHSEAQENTVQKIVEDFQASANREQRLRHELEELSRRTKSLEECVEAERAAHLESKFNSEIIQLKHEEFRNQLLSEKETCENLKISNDENKKKVIELEKQVEFELQQRKDANDKLEKTMQAYADVRKQLDQELSVKTHVISETSQKLEQHQDELRKVKDDLTKAKKKMIFVEESNNANIREIELLLESFCSDVDHGGKSKTKDERKRNMEEHSKFVLEELRMCLFSFQKKISSLQTEIEDRRSKEKGLSKDCDNFRDLAVAREKGMQQTEQALRQCKDELEVIRNQQSEFVREASRAGHDLQEMTTELDQQRERCHELEENVNSIKEMHNNEVEIHIAFLRELHHVVCSASGEKNTLTRFGWSDLSVTIRESVDVLINNLQRSKEKASQLDASSQEMQRSIAELQRAHAASVDRLADRCREREEEGARQRKQLEQHYEALLAEMNSRTRKTQSLCDEAWERIRNKDGLQDGLQAECAQLRGENTNLLQERKALSCACAILFGALYPSFRARDELAQQCSLMVRITSDSDTCQQKMRSLISTLNQELGNGQAKPTLPQSFRLIHPLIRFRVAVLCVLATNRLHLLTSHSNNLMFTCNESAVSRRRILVVAGKVGRTPPEYKSKDNVLVKSRSDAAVDWLSDNHVVHGVRDATCGLVDAVTKNAGDTSGYMSRAVVKTAKSAFLSLLESTQTRFPCYITETKNIMRERISLCRVLNDGLDKLVHNTGTRQLVNLFSVQHSFAALQSHLIDFTERLHAAEVEKRNLRHNEASLKRNLERMEDYKNQAEQHTKAMKKLKEKEKENVSRSRFEGLCSELNSALDREKKAQKLLREQNSQLQDLSERYEDQCNSGVEKEVTLSQAVSDLTEVKMELKRNFQNKRQLEKQVEKLQSERDRLQNLVRDAKSALKRAAGEKASIANYFATVEETFQTGSNVECTEKLLAQSDQMAGDCGPSLKAAKRAVDTFVRVQSTAISRINNLESQISSYRSHIASLKRELYNACHRENENTVDLELYDLPTKDCDNSHFPTAPSGVPNSFYSMTLPDASEFHPLRGELIEEMSFDKSSNSSKNLPPRPVVESDVTK